MYNLYWTLLVCGVFSGVLEGVYNSQRNKIHRVTAIAHFQKRFFFVLIEVIISDMCIIERKRGT